jgi:hypothetical protein
MVLKADSASLQLATQELSGRLRSLTELSLPLNVVHDISSVSECVGLCDLHLLVDMLPTRGVHMSGLHWRTSHPSHACMLI